ncbi:SRPBCC family protein [Arthrobacter sp. D1-29]
MSASAVIDAPRQQVWDLIKPAENGVLVDPEIVRGFSTPPFNGAGEIQVFIEVRNGVERVSAIEVVHEIPYEIAITRPIGHTDPTSRGRNTLQDTDNGATILEHGEHFSLPPGEAAYLSHYEYHHKLFCQQYVERVKAVIESSGA